MTDTLIETEIVPEAAPEAVEAATVPAAAAPAAEERRPRGGDRGRGGRPGGRPRERAPRERSEFEQATLDVRRVARVMAGGRRFSFSVTVVIGDKKGRVGVGLGKGADTALAIDKAVRSAKKALFTVPLTKDRSIAHEVSAKYASSTVEIIPSPGRGVVAGSAMRVVLEHAGVTNVIAKIQTRSKNKLTIARATIAALKKLKG
ncbi:MAG TPA: 30S ribosomal protein S5 [Candidatus Paceibacterota bacterium]|jgi:small subunit ribosomal protein S5|nr:30S ribosomal protein S5 [Candidatus Paceibacterota bacterium]